MSSQRARRSEAYSKDYNVPNPSLCKLTSKDARKHLIKSKRRTENATESNLAINVHFPPPI